MSHLNDAQFYEKLNDDPIERYSEEITSFLVHLKNREIIDKDTFNYLWPTLQADKDFQVLHLTQTA